jgi:hypothetical protein
MTSHDIIGGDKTRTAAGTAVGVAAPPAPWVKPLALLAPLPHPHPPLPPLPLLPPPLPAQPACTPPPQPPAVTL